MQGRERGPLSRFVFGAFNVKIDDFFGFIRGVVVDGNDFKFVAGVFAAAQGFERAGHDFFFVVHGHQHGDADGVVVDKSRNRAAKKQP